MMRLAFRGLPHECWARRVAVRAAARHLSLASYHTFRGFQAPRVVMIYVYRLKSIP